MAVNAPYTLGNERNDKFAILTFPITLFFCSHPIIKKGNNTYITRPTKTKGYFALRDIFIR